MDNFKRWNCRARLGETGAHIEAFKAVTGSDVTAICSRTSRTR